MKKDFIIKKICILLIFAICIPFCSCGGSEGSSELSGELSQEVIASEGASSGDASGGNASSGDTSSGNVSSGDTSGGDASSGNASSGDASGGDVSSGDVSSGDASSGNTSSGDTSSGDTSSGDVSGSDVSGSDVSGSDVSGSESADASENDKNENASNWTPDVTYYSDTGKCTYNTIYSPVVNDTLTYSNNGINLYNTDFRMSEKLEKEFLTLFGSFKKAQSVTVREMGTEFVFSYCPDTRIACASAIKGPFSLFLTKCLEQGLVSWTEKLEYAEKYDYFVGSGVIQGNYSYGTKFSVKRLYELMLNVSDNIAYLMLKDRVRGSKYFNDMVNSLGCKDIIDWGNWGNLTSYEMALIWREIYYYVTISESSYAEKLYKELYNARYNELWKAIPRCENLHKSGWSANGYNDAGVLFDGEQTYVVAIMTGRKDLADSENARHLTKIAKLVDKLMLEYNAYLAENTGDSLVSEEILQ